MSTSPSCLCGGRRGTLCLENRCHRPLLLMSHVQLLDGCCHLFPWLLCFHCWHAVLPNLLWIPTLEPSLAAATVRLLRFFLTGLTPASPGALRSKLSLGALRSTRQQVTIPVFREAITAPIPCCGRIHMMRFYMHSFLRSERGCSATQH